MPREERGYLTPVTLLRSRNRLVVLPPLAAEVIIIPLCLAIRPCLMATRWRRETVVVVMDVFILQRYDPDGLFARWAPRRDAIRCR